MIIYVRLISENDLGERFENPNVVERYKYSFLI